MQAGSVAVLTLNRVTRAVLDESRSFLVPLSSFLDFFRLGVSLPDFPIWVSCCSSFTFNGRAVNVP